MPRSTELASNAAVPTTVLVADDDDGARRVLSRAAANEGCSVHTVSNGEEAVAAFEHHSFDLVLTDIDMPGRDGIALLRAIRERDLDVPVVLVTGGPSLETAILAVELGASHYLTKPLDVPALKQTIRRALHAGRLARARRNLSAIAGHTAMQIGDLAGLGGRFDKALLSAFMLYQPIVRWSSRSIFAYEGLVRSAEPTISNPDALFDAAERLDRMFDVGRRTRSICGSTPGRAADVLLFVNLHPGDLMDDALYEADSPLTRIAGSVVLEVTERARLEQVRHLSEGIARLRSIGFRIAIDDLGAGYAGLTSFAALEPDFVKVDQSLIRDIHRSSTKMVLVGAMIRACKDLAIEVIVEGVEAAAERDALLGLDCDLLQGFLFARPEQPFTTASF